MKRQILTVGQKFFFWPKLFFGINSSNPLLRLSFEKWMEVSVFKENGFEFSRPFTLFPRKGKFWLTKANFVHSQKKSSSEKADFGHLRFLKGKFCPSDPVKRQILAFSLFTFVQLLFLY